jgi:hypothetical protein
MSTRCKTHQAEPSSTEEKPGGLDRHAFDRFPKGSAASFLLSSGCRAFSTYGGEGRRDPLLQSTAEQLSNPALRSPLPSREPR